jgi:hypothetical protein
MDGSPCFTGVADHPDVPKLERWQMAIYRELFRKDTGLRDRWGEATKTYRYTLPQYAQMVLGERKAEGRADLQTPGTAATVYHLFGLSNISPFHRDLIGRLADESASGAGAARFEIYALNPCAEFWEDALTDRERQARARNRSARRLERDEVVRAKLSEDEIVAGALTEIPDDNKLLSMFGKPGRETIKLWCQLTDYTFEEDFRNPKAKVAPEKITLLDTIRKSVLSRIGPLPSENMADPGGVARLTPGGEDNSLRIFSAPDPRTEMEDVRAAIAERLGADKTLRPEDMAIIPADPDAALPLIRAVFAGGRDAVGNVPVLLPGADTATDSPLLRGFRDLLAPRVLAADRNAVLALLENPAVRRKAGLDADGLGGVRRFWEKAGFQEGWGSEADAGTSTAKAAVERAVLARVFDPDDEAMYESMESDLWPAREVTGLLDREVGARLIDWLARLGEALHPFRGNDGGGERSFSEWATRLRALFDGFLQAEDDDAADRRAETELRAFFAAMETWDSWSQPPERVSGEVVRTLFEDAFRDPGAARTAFLRGGVRVGGINALRGLPFRHVWVTGLAAGVFPAPGEAAPLDLRGYRRLPGESDPAARDLYALLEVIASTTDSLTLSWVRRKAAKDADVSPSRALTGLKAWVESDVIAEGSMFRFEELHAARLPSLQEPAAVARPVAWAEPPAREFLRADWSHLADFLENPALHTAKVHFGFKPYDALDFSEEERAAALFFDRRTDTDILDTVLRAELTREGDAARAFELLWKERKRGGLLPPPPYDAVEHDRLLAEITGPLSEKMTHLRKLLEENSLAFAGSLRVGPQDSSAAEPPVVSIPAFDARPLGVPVLVGGILRWFFHCLGSVGGWALMVEAGRESPAYFLQLCVAALEENKRPSILRGQGHLIVHDKEAKAADKAFALHPLPEAWEHDAVTTLHDLLLDLAAAPGFDDLPLKDIEKVRKDAGDDARIEDWGEEIEEWRRGEEENTFGGPRFWDRVLGTLQVEVPENANNLVLRRAIPYLAWKTAWKPVKKGKGKNGASEDSAAEDPA